MNTLRRLVPLAVALNFAGGVVAHAQARPTAVQGLQLSAFGGLSGVYTGLDPYGTDGPQGKNLDFTAGVDLGFRPRYGLFPSIEVRGSYPVGNGSVDSQENILGGIKLATHRYGHIRPYIDGLFGRGSITYTNGYPNPSLSFIYLRTPSNIYALGGGVDLGVTPHFDLKFDAQAYHYNTPVTRSGDLFAIPLTAAVVYHFDFNHHYRRGR